MGSDGSDGPWWALVTSSELWWALMAADGLQRVLATPSGLCQALIICRAPMGTLVGPGGPWLSLLVTVARPTTRVNHGLVPDEILNLP